jgi:hypothetical protein
VDDGFRHSDVPDEREDDDDGGDGDERGAEHDLERSHGDVVPLSALDAV